MYFFYVLIIFMFSVKKYSPDYSKLVNHGNFGDIYSSIEDKNILIKLINKTDCSGEINRKIINKTKKHKNIMKIFGFENGVFGSFNIIYLEHIHGIILSQYIDNYEINEKFIYNTIFQLINALHYLHKNKITHRDIKLNNIIYQTHNKQIKIIDFGLAYYGLPCKGMVGTSGYLAPEIINNPDSYGHKSDIWSAGCILYYLVTYTFPFYSAHKRELYIQQIKDKISIKYNNNIWKNYLFFKFLCSNMIVYDENKRYSSKECLHYINNIFCNYELD